MSSLDLMKSSEVRKACDQSNNVASTYIFDQIQFQNQRSDQTTQSLETKLVWNLASSKY